jgi:hypothetical protein
VNVHRAVMLDITDQILIRFLHSSDTVEKLEYSYNETTHQVFINFNSHMIQLRMMYSIFIEFGVPMKLVG